MNGTTSTAAQNIYTSSIGRLTVDIESGATAGTAKIRADRSSGNPYGCYCDVYETIYTPTPTTVQINAGNNQSADVSTAFGATMKAKVVDAGGAAIAGVTVTFTNPASGASALFSNASNVCTANTDGSGIATSLSFTANAVPGAWGCVASCSPATSATFTQNNIGTGAELDDTLMYSEA
jgi:hypothetical protein